LCATERGVVKQPSSACLSLPVAPLAAVRLAVRRKTDISKRRAHLSLRFHGLLAGYPPIAQRKPRHALRGNAGLLRAVRLGEAELELNDPEPGLHVGMPRDGLPGLVQQAAPSSVLARGSALARSQGDAPLHAHCVVRVGSTVTVRIGKRVSEQLICITDRQRFSSLQSGSGFASFS
jgi:hypothetical protein